ncbi:Aminomethyltransferase (glycine cleavage system T protein) [hydrothermal vent metagenome]|uniref:aminomethyltransferase n=1 Tax=hydrothermal vent metagenome TaxID=652676 RepID=A0A3B0TVG0_9ZZZZ
MTGFSGADGQGEANARTPLYDLHIELGAKMVPFTGYDLPVRYPAGILAEHNHTRRAAGLFDVSHMGQAFLVGPDHETVATALEALTPGNINGLGPGRQRYTLLLNDDGGILDDLMVSREDTHTGDGQLYLVVNAARKSADYARIRANLPAGIELRLVEDRALLALQGPQAVQVMARHCPQAAQLGFMGATRASFDGIDCHISRSGYTGEDGFEISMAAGEAETVARALLAEPEVAPIGLGARDSLRLEAGLCLYGHDIDETTSPIEADLAWAVSKRRREEGGFPGAKRILAELAQGPARVRVGILPQGRAPAREHTEIRKAEGGRIGSVTSGGFGPTVGGPIAMGYVETAFAEPGTEINLLVRGRALPAQVVELPFVPHNFLR